MPPTMMTRPAVAAQPDLLLSVEQLRHRYGPVIALDGVDLHLPPGTRRAVIGANGAGKTTLFHLIAGTQRPHHGRIRLAGHDVTRVGPARRARRGVGRTFQHPALADQLTAVQNIAVAVARHVPVPVWPPRHPIMLLDHAVKVLHQHKLAEYADIPAGQLPYGIQRRLEVAAVLTGRPRLLLLDEPCAGLDPDDITHLAATIRDLPTRVTVLFIEHHLDFVWQVADTVTVLDHGRHLATGTPDEIRANPAVRDAYLHHTPADHPHPTAPTPPRARERVTVNARPAGDAVQGAMAPVARLRVDDLTAGHGDALVLHDITLHLAPGEILAVTGPNGAGKSTLIDAIAGILPTLPSGTVHLDGQPLPQATHLIARAGIAVVPQGRRLFADLTAGEHLTAAHRTGAAWDRDAVLDLFPALRDRLRHRPTQLSGGEQQMLAAARALLAQPRVLLLDEPAEGLAPAITAALDDAVRRVAATGVAVLITEHDLRRARTLADRVAVLHHGHITSTVHAEQLDLVGPEHATRAADA